MTQTASISLSDHKMTVEDIVARLTKREALPQGVDEAIVLAAVARILSRAGAALAVQTKKPEQILASLGKMEALAGLKGQVVTAWIGLRALDLPAGAQISVSDAHLCDPILSVFFAASGLIPTTDISATVRGVFGDLGGRDLQTLHARARIVTMPAKNGLHIANSGAPLFSIDTSDFIAAAATVDANSTSVTAASVNKIAPLVYNGIQAAQLGEFAPTVFSNYKVRRIEIPGAQPHPDELVESSALASVLPPVPTYQPHFNPDVVTRGLLSDVQLETVIYAGEAHSKYLPAHPDDDAKVPPRQGFLVGHGTGVGKNRIGAGIIADNWAQGRRRHIWLSENPRLIIEARDDWEAFGGRADDVVDIRDLPQDGSIPPFSGIVFASYASLRSVTAAGTRLKQLIEWFGHGEDGVILIDEAQNLRNAKDKDDGTFWSDASLQGEAALELQDALPNARVTYLSATSASDIVSLGFVTRLGLWGRWTSFPTASRFFRAMEDGGTNALEMVARDLKAMGLYLAANMSFENVTYERLHHKLSPSERALQDTMSEMWLKVFDGLNRAMVTVGASRMPGKMAGKLHQNGSIHFGMSRARFFQALDASLNTPCVIEAVRRDVADGASSIVQLTNTFAANAERSIAAAEEAGDSLDSVEATPKDILTGYLTKQFPVHKLRAVRRGKKTYAEIVLDAAGKPVECPQAVAIRNQLLVDLAAIKLPEGPLEQIMKAFGPGIFAEVSGRSRRLIPGPNGGQVLENRSPQDVINDANAFMDDTKRCLVFSKTGSVGGTLSAQRRRKNQRLRRHYLLQVGLRADLALQGMGRSHRSDQAQAPQYILVSNDLWASQRTISAIARGMRDLGALTRGLRQAASQDFFSQDENLEDEYAQAAWLNFVQLLASGKVHGLSLAQFEREACLKIRSGKSILRSQVPSVRRFLNAMSAMRCDSQALFGQYYRMELQAMRLAALEDGSFDRGVETIVPDNLIKIDDQVIYDCPRTGAQTRLLKMLRIDELKPIGFDDARRKGLAKGSSRVVKSLVTGRIAVLAYPTLPKGASPSAQDKVEVIMPTGSRIRTREEVSQERWVQVETILAEHLWNAELKERGDEEERDFWLISGALLPIWDKLPRDRATVYRMETDEGEQIIGRLVSESFVGSFLQRVDALKGGGLSAATVDETLCKGGVVTLANGWICQGRVSTQDGTSTIILSMPLEDEIPYQPIITTAGLKRAIGPLTTMAYYKVPADGTLRERAIASLLAQAPAVGASSL